MKRASKKMLSARVLIRRNEVLRGIYIQRTEILMRNYFVSQLLFLDVVKTENDLLVNL